MKGKAIIPLVLGLGIGIFAIKMFFNVLNKAKGSTGETVQVVRAKIDIMPTLEITEQMVEMAGVPESLCPKLAARDIKEVVGRVTANSIPQGCPIVASLLAPKGTLPGMAARIRDGYRAVAVKVDESVGVAGWLKPGSRVDVVAVMTGKGGAGNEIVSSVILQDVGVLAVGQEIGNNGETGAAVTKSVTLEVAPDDVPKLHLAATKGTIRLAMRNQADDNPLRAASASDKDIVGLSTSTGRNVAKPSFLENIFGKLPKMQAKATDKRVVATKPAAEVKQAPVARRKPGWVVEIVSGGQLIDWCFTGSDKSAKSMGLGCTAGLDPTEPQTQEKPAGKAVETAPPAEPKRQEIQAESVSTN